MLLPKSDRFIVAVDIDDTLVRLDESVNNNVLEFIFVMDRLNAFIILWSGGGEDYARHWGRRLGLDPFIDLYSAKTTDLQPHLTVDDGPEVDFGCPNILVRNPPSFE